MQDLWWFAVEPSQTYDSLVVRIRPVGNRISEGLGAICTYGRYEYACPVRALIDCVAGRPR